MLTASVHPRLQFVWLNANQKYTKVMASWQLLQMISKVCFAPKIWSTHLAIVWHAWAWPWSMINNKVACMSIFLSLSFPFFYCPLIWQSFQFYLACQSIKCGAYQTLGPSQRLRPSFLTAFMEKEINLELIIFLISVGAEKENVHMIHTQKQAYMSRSITRQRNQRTSKLIVLVQLFVGSQGPRFSGLRGKELCTFASA